MKHPKVCRTCISYDPTGGSSEGFCTRYPVWEGVYSTHYCGEHEYNLVIQQELGSTEEQIARDKVNEEFARWLGEINEHSRRQSKRSNKETLS